MIACKSCGNIIVGEMSAEGTHVGACPGTLTTKSSLAPFGKSAVVGRNEIKLSDLQMGAVQLSAKALYDMNQEINSAAILRMWPDDDESFTGVKPTEYHLETYLKTKAFLTDMGKRGVRLNEMEFQLTTEQFAFIELCRNPQGRQFSTILKRAKVPKSKFNSWMKQPVFNNYFQKMVGDNTEQALLLSEISLASKAEDGDLNATKFLWEYKDKFTENKQASTQGMELVNIVLDAVQQVVTDPEQLEQIRKIIQFKATGLGM